MVVGEIVVNVPYQSQKKTTGFKKVSLNYLKSENLIKFICILSENYFHCHWADGLKPTFF